MLSKQQFFCSSKSYKFYIKVIFQSCLLLYHLNKLILNMQVFRKKYLYNPQNPVFENQVVKTFPCMDSETKNNKLLLLQHLVQPPQVLPEKGVLQPIQFPTLSEKISVYPLVNCCSEIGKLNEVDAMYIIKSLVQCKLKNPTYYLLSPSGVCCSEIEGLLPNRSPDLFNLSLSLLDLPPNLIESQKSVVSKNGYAICRSIRDKNIDESNFSVYGWKDVKKDKQNIKDDTFWVFKGRRKEQGPFGEEYGLAWNSNFGLSRLKYIDLNKDAYQDQFEDQFNNKVKYFQKNAESNSFHALQIHKIKKDNSGIRIFTSIANQGNLNDYIQKKNELDQKLTDSNMLSILEVFVRMMNEISKSQIKGHSALHIKNVYVHDNRLTIGQPMFITDKKEKKLRQLKKGLDYFAPQLKQNIILPQKLFKMDQQKMDIWSFGFILHKIFTGEVPVFDSNKKPIIEKSSIGKGMKQLIKNCLNLDPQYRPKWADIDLRNLKTEPIVQEYKQDIISEHSQKIRLDSPTRQRKIKLNKDHSSNKQNQSERLIIARQQQAKVPVEEEQAEQKFEYMLPPEMSSKLKRIKLTVKIVIIMIMYLIVFFGKFFENSLNILILKDKMQKSPLHLVDQSGNILSSTTILTAESKFFLLNDISFTDVQNVYHCINDSFDPINNPDYSLLNYIQSSNFQALILTGWAAAIIICSIKAISIWKGGIANRPRKASNRYWLVYAFHQLSLASLLFAHFFIYQFFYFSGISPCFYIEDYAGVQPFFDSSLYLFLDNQNGYLENVFASLGVLSVILCISGCFYAWGPKFDLKYFVSVPSIMCRVTPYILLILLCRIGVFSLFSPTAVNDQTDIIPSIISGSARGFFGIIPEIFIMICVAIQVVLELLLYWCEQKASENDSLSKMFNINDRKISRNGSGTNGINDMSLQNSKSNLNEYEQFK